MSGSSRDSRAGVPANALAWLVGLAVLRVMRRFLEHTGELELEGDTREAVLGEALAAIRELVSNRAAGPSVQHEIQAAAADDTAMLAVWLEELLFLVETDDFVPEGIDRLAVVGCSIDATVRGRRGRPRHLVKAVSYQDLALEPRGNRWHEHCVLDV